MRYLLGRKMLGLPRRAKQAILIAADLFFIEFAIWAAFALRLDTLSTPFARMAPLFWLAPLLALPVFIRLGLYRAIMRYVGLHAMITIGKAVTLYSVMLAAAVYLLAIHGIPRSVAPIQGLLVLLMIGGSRALARHWLASAERRQFDDKLRRRVMIYGAGSAGIQLAAALSHSRELLPVGLLDDDPALQGKQIGALRVFNPAQLPDLIERHEVAEILLAIPSASRQRRNEIIDSLEPLPVLVRTLPGVAELAQGKISVGDLREIDIEDLLGRDPVAPDAQLLRANIAGKAVMITGAGGSIGAELCRQILAQGPTQIVLYELNEFALYHVEQQLLALRQQLQSTVPIWPLLGSVTDQPRLERALRHFGIQTLFHAAAYKHVPMVEKNPCAGATNNVLGTWHAAHAALACSVETFVLISTDKAVRPTNTMGATKRLAEMVLQALAAKHPERTRFTMVRFGNVLGSSGSVIPLFRKQIHDGGPVTVTDPRIIRYFMTIPEAAQLVIQAGAMGQDGDVFVLDMGEPVKILDLARRMIHLSGLSVREDDNRNGDIEIVFTGLRPGEKLYEELLIGANATPTSHPRIQRANEAYLDWAELEAIVAELRTACTNDDGEQVRETLRRAVPEFSPQCGNEDLLRSPATDAVKQ